MRLFYVSLQEKRKLFNATVTNYRAVSF